MITAFIIALCSSGVSAESKDDSEITDIKREYILIHDSKHKAYYKRLEEKYKMKVLIYECVLEDNGFYKAPIKVRDAELKILRDIESAFAMLPEGFVREIADYFINEGFEPSIEIRGGTFEDGNIGGRFYIDDISIHIVGSGNELIHNLLHELGHKIEYYISHKDSGAWEKMPEYFAGQNKASEYQYNEDYKGLDKIDLKEEYYDYYITKYSSCSFNEDFAELFAYGILQPKYISSYGNGKVKPIHNKIKMISEVLCADFKSLKNSKLLMNCMPDAPSEWAEPVVKSAKEKGIIPWNIYGMNNSDITRHHAALILQPFLYRYIDEDALLKKANLSKNYKIPEDFVYDVVDGNDVLLLNNLKILQVEKGHFNPAGKIKMKEAADIFAKTAKLFDLPGTDITKIMTVNGKKDYNAEKYIAYQEFYAVLLNICSLKDAYNAKNKISAPASAHYEDLQHTAISESGWIYYYNYFTNANGTYSSRPVEYIGLFTGTGKLVWDDAEFWFEGEWKNGKFWNGSGRILIGKDSWFEGELKKGGIWNGEGVISQNGRRYKIEVKDGVIRNKGEMKK